MKSIIVEIRHPDFEARGNKVFTSLEGENPGGSIKDHMVLGELKELLAQGTLNKNDVVCEASAGSTAQSLAYHCNELHLGCSLFVPDTLAGDKIEALKSLGAVVYAVDPKTAYVAYNEFTESHRVHPFNQLTDVRKRRHYAPLGREVVRRMGVPTILFGAVGTGHSLLGLADAIGSEPLVVSVEPQEAGAVLGARNILLERYGENDPLSESSFDFRFIVSSKNFSTERIVSTSGVEIFVGDSFRMVFAGARKFLADRTNQKVFLVGANNKRS